MKYEESTEKKALKKLSPIDIIMIIITGAGIVAAIVFGIIMLVGGKSTPAKQEQSSADFEYKIVVSAVDTGKFGFAEDGDGQLTSDFLKVGDKVYDRKSGEVIGTVKSLTFEDCMMPTGDISATGELEYAKYPGYIDLIITVSATSDKKDGSFVVNSYRVRAGESVAFHTYGYYADGEILSVNKPAAEG